MKSIIDSIYDGDIRPAEDILSYSDKLQKLCARSAKMLTDIGKTVPEDLRAMIDEYADLKNRICEESAKTGFRVGLSMGIKLMTESFSNAKDLIEEMESDNT